jgi:hypothetical protein
MKNKHPAVLLLSETMFHLIYRRIFMKETIGKKWKVDHKFVSLAETNKERMMKTIGLLGGMSWESTIPYYRLINEGIKARLACTRPACCCTASISTRSKPASPPATGIAPARSWRRRRSGCSRRGRKDCPVHQHHA